MTRTNHPRRILPLLALAAVVALPGSLRSQPAGPVLVGLEPATGGLVPVDLDVVRRPGELRLDPSTGALSLVGAAPVPDGRMALLAFDPSTGALAAVDVQVVRGPGEIRLDPGQGGLTATGLGPRPAATGPSLVGFDPATRTLAPVELGLRPEPGAYALDVRAAVLSPAPSQSALLAFDAGTLVPVAVTLVRGRGGLVVDPRTGRVSPVAEAPAASAPPLALLGIRPEAGALIPVDLGPAYLPGVLAIDPATGRISPAGDAPVQDPRGGRLTVLGVQTPTGALTRAEVEPTRRAGEFAVDLVSGTLEEVAPPPPPGEEAGFVFGGGLDVRQMLELENVLAEIDVSTTGPDATGLAPGVHGFAEYRWKAISFGIEGAYSKMNTEVSFPQGLQMGDLTYTEIGGNVKIAVPLEGPLSPYGTFSIVRARTEADFELAGLTESRTHNTKRDGIGAGVDYWGSPHWGFRVEGLYSTTFEDGDAAEHIRWRLGVLYSPAGVRRDRDGF